MPRGGKGGKGKSHKGQRRHFTNEEELHQQEERERKQKEWRKKQGIESEEESEEEEKPEAGFKQAANVGDLPPSDSEEESESEDEDAKPKGVEHLIQIENPNRAKKQTRKVTDLDADSEKPQLSRREREELEKQQAKANYRKLHEAGKTEEARADLARLALIRKQREETAKKREEERLQKEKEKQVAEQKLKDKRKGANN